MAQPRRLPTSQTSVGLQMLNGSDLIKQLEALAIQVREQIGKDALEAGMKPVQAAVIALAPESSVTGSREKQSSKTRQKWSGSKKLKSVIR